MRKAEALGRSLGSDRFRAPTFGQAWSRVEASFRQAPHARRPKPRRRNLKAMPPNGFHRRPKRLRRHSWRRALLRCKPPLLPPQPGVPSTRQCRLPVGPVPTSSAAPLSDDAVRSATASPIDRVQIRPLYLPRARVHHGGRRRGVRARRVHHHQERSSRRPALPEWTQISTAPTKLEPGWSMRIGQWIATYRAGPGQ